jgi:hypothetical protein
LLQRPLEELSQAQRGFLCSSLADTSLQAVELPE